MQDRRNRNRFITLPFLHFFSLFLFLPSQTVATTLRSPSHHPQNSTPDLTSDGALIIQAGASQATLTYNKLVLRRSSWGQQATVRATRRRRRRRARAQTHLSLLPQTNQHSFSGRCPMKGQPHNPSQGLNLSPFSISLNVNYPSFVNLFALSHFFTQLQCDVVMILSFYFFHRVRSTFGRGNVCENQQRASGRGRRSGPQKSNMRRRGNVRVAP